MSKLSFRARALDASKPLPVFRCEDLPDLHEYASINRAVPQMPTGMEKEEESVGFSLFTRCLWWIFYFCMTEASLFFSAPAFTKWRTVFWDITRRICPLNGSRRAAGPGGLTAGHGASVWGETSGFESCICG
uniref:Enhancer of polycomb homolog 1 n=1 Tax=Neogobius melanostomus TaxID=47308 RepID=A0A8C6SEE7_9GOBI